MRALTLLLAAGAAGLAGAAQAQNQSDVTYDCDRACLTGFVDAWLDGLVANDPGAVPLAADAKITLNSDIVSAADSFWDVADSVQARIDIANPR